MDIIFASRPNHRKIIRLMFLLLVTAINLSTTWENPDWLLTDIDRKIEEEQNSPALSSGLHEKVFWESFNEWQCFLTSTIRLTCAQHALEPEKTPMTWTEVASIQVESPHERLSFDFEDWRDSECNEILREIKALLTDEPSLCIFAAYLQELDDNHSYWVPTVLKTAKGYWPNQDFMAYRR